MRFLPRRLAIVIALGCFLGGCAGDLPPGLDSRGPWARDASASSDSGWVSDFRLPFDGYAGSPFGCSVDADCGVQRCCETPWGVKLCADFCAP